MAELNSESFLEQQFNVWFCGFLWLLLVGWVCLVFFGGGFVWGGLGIFVCVLGFWLVGLVSFVFNTAVFHFRKNLYFHPFRLKKSLTDLLLNAKYNMSVNV